MDSPSVTYCYASTMMASTTSYSYDVAGRLATMVDPKGNTWRYTYDMAGNKLTASDPGAGLTTMTYDNGDRLVTTTDARGQGVRNVYDNLDRVIATKTLDDTVTLTSSVYDTLKPGLLTSTTRHVQGATLTVAGTDLTIDNSTGVKAAARYYSHAGHTVAVRTGNTNATLFSVIGDHQGTAHHQIRNSDSQLRTTWQDPYGGKRGTPPAGWAGERGFVGGLQDATGLIRIGIRDYDTLLQRFTTVDPVLDVADPLGWNPYVYAGNTPVTKADPTGAAPCIDSCDWDQRHKTQEYQAREYKTITGKWPAGTSNKNKTSGPMALTSKTTKGKNPYEKPGSGSPKPSPKPNPMPVAPKEGSGLDTVDPAQSPSWQWHEFWRSLPSLDGGLTAAFATGYALVHTGFTGGQCRLEASVDLVVCWGGMTPRGRGGTAIGSVFVYAGDQDPLLDRRYGDRSGAPNKAYLDLLEHEYAHAQQWRVLGVNMVWDVPFELVGLATGAGGCNSPYEWSADFKKGNYQC